LAPGRQCGNALLGVRHQEEDPVVVVWDRAAYKFSLPPYVVFVNAPLF